MSALLYRQRTVESQSGYGSCLRSLQWHYAIIVREEREGEEREKVSAISGH